MNLQKVRLCPIPFLASLEHPLGGPTAKCYAGAMRKTPFVNGELYHIFNRGVDKRSIYRDIEDVERFLESIKKFNSLTPIGSLYELSFNSLGGPTAKSDDCDEKLV